MVYDQYAADMTKVYDEFYKVVKDYVAVPIIKKVISPRKAAHFFQIDRRLYALLDLQIVSQTPLIVQ